MYPLRTLLLIAMAITGAWPAVIDAKADFSAVGDGSTDDTPFILAAVADLKSGDTLFIPDGTYSLNSTALAVTPLRPLCDNVTIIGAGHGATSLVIAGSSVCAPFVLDGRSNIRISGLTLEGNAQATAYANGVCVSWTSAGATGALTGLTIDHCRFTNCKGDYWIYVQNTLGTYPMSGLTVEHCVFDSAAGNARGPTSIGINSACVMARGHDTMAYGYVSDIRISNCVANIPHIKTFAQVFGNCRSAYITDNSVISCGTTSAIGNDCGAYAILCYNNSSGGSMFTGDITIRGNIIGAVRSCGVYGVRCSGLSITGNMIDNQTDTVTATLPKGGLALNACTSVTISGNHITDCYRGISFLGWMTDAGGVIVGNTITNAGNIGLYVSSSGADWTGCQVYGNSISAMLYGICVDAAGYTSGGISITGNQVASSHTGIGLVSSDATYALSGCEVRSNTVVGHTNPFLYGIDCHSFNDKGVILSGNQVTGPSQSGGSAYYIDNAKRLVCHNNTSSGVALGWYATGAEGFFRDNDTTSVTTRIYSSGGQDLGRIKPTWAGWQSAYVDAMNPVEVGSSGSKYIVRGWLNDGSAWQECRVLTGN